MPSLLTLLLFCDFLENRLYTSNLALFRRMLSDFFAGNEHTLQDFIRLGASMVTVIPIERKSQRHQQEASRLLSEQQQMTEESKQQSPFCFFCYLSARVATKNIFWLREMFHEFCTGDDTLVCEFVGRGNEAISVIPMDIHTQVTQQPTTATSGSEMPALGQREEKFQQESDSESEDDDEILTLAELAMVASIPANINDLCTCIMTVLDRLEEQEPWKQVYNPDTLPMPVKRSKLTAALKTFWTENGRAVWERRFWGPLLKMPDRRRYFARKARQAKARGSFTKVMTLAYEQLGAKFFVQLDQRRKPHQGWWYAEPVQDLFSIAQRQDLAACLDYMESQALERFPVVPGNETRVAKRTNLKSKSMWATTSDMAPILRDICTIKAQN